MGSGASADVSADIKEKITSSSQEDITAALKGLAPETLLKMQTALGGGVKVFAMPPSANAMSPVLLAMDSGAGGLEMCDLQAGAQLKPEFLAMNPFHHIPTLKDGDFAMAEGLACLRYLAMKYKPAYYPVADAAACGWIDFAMESFAGDVYPKWSKIVYPVVGFSGPTEDMPKALEEAKAIMDTWVAHFLKGKFVNGDSLSIADFKAAPFLFYYVQPGIEKQGFVASDRVKQYVEDFCAATSASAMLKSAGGFSIAEFCAMKVPDAEKESKAFSKPTIDGKPALGATSGKVQVFGMPPSCNAIGPVLMAMDAGVGGIEMCNLMEGAHMKPDFLAMNPFHHIPTLKDGEYAIAESCATIRYIAAKYKPEYYPTKDPQTCGRIDFAMESFSGDVYPKWAKVVYPLMGFSGPTEDPAKAATELTEILDTWVTHFLKGKFVNGDALSIADFKAGPFCFALTQPGIEAKAGFKPSDRVKKYAEDFVAASPACAMLSEAGGFSVKEYIAMKAAA